MGITPKTVFISYRRTNFYTALAVYQDLTANGYDCFFDYESIESGDFESVIFENIRYRVHFVVILSPSALERLGEKGSVMRREVELAIDEKRNIIPLMMESFDFGSPSAKAALAGKLESLSSYNGLKLVPEYIFAGMEKLRRFSNVELEDVRQPALSATVEESTEKRQEKAKEEPVVQEEALTAEEWFERGYAFGENKNYEEAVRCYLKAIELNPEDSDAYYNMGNDLYSLNRHKDAENAYHEAIRINPRDEMAYHNLGSTFYILERYEEAEEAYRKAIKINPKYHQAYNNLGYMLDELKRYREAVSLYQKAIKISPKDPMYHNNLGYSLANQKRYNEAQKAYYKTIQIDPKNYRAYNNLGELFYMLKTYEEAEKNYQKAIKNNPKYETAYSNLGNLLVILQRYDEAIETYQKVIQLSPQDAYAYYDLGFAQHLKKNLNGASINYKKALEIEQDYVAPRIALFGLLQKLGKNEEAQKHKQVLHNLIQNEDEYNRACFQSNCANIEKALELLRISVEKEATNKDWAKQDPDLENLRADPRFWEIIGEEMPKQ